MMRLSGLMWMGALFGCRDGYDAAVAACPTEGEVWSSADTMGEERALHLEGECLEALAKGVNADTDGDDLTDLETGWAYLFMEVWSMVFGVPWEGVGDDPVLAPLLPEEIASAPDDERRRAVWAWYHDNIDVVKVAFPDMQVPSRFHAERGTLWIEPAYVAQEGQHRRLPALMTLAAARREVGVAAGCSATDAAWPGADAAWGGPVSLTAAMALRRAEVSSGPDQQWARTWVIGALGQLCDPSATPDAVYVRLDAALLAAEAAP